MLKKLRGLKYPKSITSNLDKGINLLIIREEFTEESTIGNLYLDGEWLCDTLELPYIDNQKSISCIPAGRYKARLWTARESAT